MPTVADALRQHADGYLRMPTEHNRVVAAIKRCRTGALGYAWFAQTSDVVRIATAGIVGTESSLFLRFPWAATA